VLGDSHCSSPKSSKTKDWKEGERCEAQRAQDKRGAKLEKKANVNNKSALIGFFKEIIDVAIL
jgi:hypothetical protein